MLHAGYSVTPLRFEFPVPAGKTHSEVIRIVNEGKEPVMVRLYTRDFRQDAHGGETESEAGAVERGCSSWLTIAPTDLTIAPGARAEARLTIAVPEPSTGTYWAFVFIEQTSKPQPKRATNKEGYSMEVLVKPRWCIRVHETVPGTEKRSGQVTDMAMSRSATDGKTRFDVEFANEGNTLLKCKGKVEIRDAKGQVVQTLPLKENGLFYVYPGGKRRVPAVCAEVLPAGTYVALAMVDIGNVDLMAGELEFEVK